TWVRLAQRIPVRVHIDHVPKGVVLSAGQTATVEIDTRARPPRQQSPARRVTRRRHRRTPKKVPSAQKLASASFRAIGAVSSVTHRNNMNRQLPFPPNEEREGDTGAVIGCARQTTPRGEHFHKLDARFQKFRVSTDATGMARARGKAPK